MKNSKLEDKIIFIINICLYIIFIIAFLTSNHNLFKLMLFMIILSGIFSLIILFVNKSKNIYKLIIFIFLVISLILRTTFIHPAIKKPIIYIYPEEKTDLIIKLKNNNLITHSYPKYKNEWNINADINGNIYDYKTKKNYYALYWEGKNTTKINLHEGFLVEGENISAFLEEKLNYLGLNEKESEEFIIYWLPKLEDSKYIFVRFKTIDEINKYMPLDISKKPDTLIRVYADFKLLNKKINVKEQRLERKTRKGFTIVEWGASIY